MELAILAVVLRSRAPEMPGRDSQSRRVFLMLPMRPGK